MDAFQLIAYKFLIPMMPTVPVTEPPAPLLIGSRDLDCRLLEPMDLLAFRSLVEV